MDLSHLRFDFARHTPLTSELAVMMVGVAARQAASPTALVQARIGTTQQADAVERFAPVDGAFNRPVAEALARWQRE